MDAFNVVAGVASILGTLIGIGTLIIASSVKKQLRELGDRYQRRIRLGELRRSLDLELDKLQEVLEQKQIQRGTLVAATVTAILESIKKYSGNEFQKRVEQCLKSAEEMSVESDAEAIGRLGQLQRNCRTLSANIKHWERDIAWSSNK